MAKVGKNRNTRMGGNTVVGYGFTPANPNGNRAERRAARRLRLSGVPVELGELADEEEEKG